MLVLVVGALSAPGTARAFGATGHRVVGAIAQLHLSDAAREGIEALLGAEDLAEASTWADFMRSSRDPFWRSADPWHYVTIPPGKRYAEVGAPREGDAITALHRFSATITDAGASSEERRRSLRFIVHLVADLHQPLHAGNGRDRGGNDIRVRFFGEPMNLHALWDRGLIDHEKLSYTEMAAWLDRRITPGMAARWSVTDPVVWAEESAAIRDGIYPQGPTDLGFDYVYEHRETLHRRLSQAGVRLAAYLNEIFAAQERR